MQNTHHTTPQGLTRYISTSAPAAAPDAAGAASEGSGDVGTELDGLVLCGEKGKSSAGSFIHGRRR